MTVSRLVIGERGRSLAMMARRRQERSKCPRRDILAADKESKGSNVIKRKSDNKVSDTED